jgi:hypothetical protein
VTYFEAKVSKEAASCPQKFYEESRVYDRETIQAGSLSELLEEIEDRIPVSLESGSEVYRGEGRETGRIYSFWKTNYSRQYGKTNTWEKWWIEIREVEEETVKPETWMNQFSTQTEVKVSSE